MKETLTAVARKLLSPFHALRNEAAGQQNSGNGGACLFLALGSSQVSATAGKPLRNPLHRPQATAGNGQAADRWQGPGQRFYRGQCKCNGGCQPCRGNQRNALVGGAVGASLPERRSAAGPLVWRTSRRATTANCGAVFARIARCTRCVRPSRTTRSPWQTVSCCAPMPRPGRVSMLRSSPRKKCSALGQKRRQARPDHAGRRSDRLPFGLRSGTRWQALLEHVAFRLLRGGVQ